jgi:AcrR family transcriptional regulator
MVASLNTMSTHLRKYRLKARADRQRQTRDRIVAATVALHREVGPARTTIADVARRAGVQRLTVYNHFAQLGDLLGACQGRFLAENPPPDIAPGPAPHGILDRLEEALTHLYGWFRANESMQGNVHRDRHLVPELDELMGRTADPVFEAASAAYAQRLGAPQPLIRLALEFRTWEVMAGGGLADAEIARLFRRAISCVSKTG